MPDLTSKMNDLSLNQRNPSITPPLSDCHKCQKLELQLQQARDDLASEKMMILMIWNRKIDLN
jgi:hypothetical protein